MKYRGITKANNIFYSSVAFANDKSTELVDEATAGTNVTNLISQFTVSIGATVKVGGTTQVSNQTVNNFTNSVIYTVTAEDGLTTKSYTVIVSF